MISSINLDMLAVLGDEYIAQHCLQEFRRKCENEQFRTYIADTLYLISHGNSPSERYSDLIEQPGKKQDNRTEKEMISDFAAKFKAAGGEVDDELIRTEC